MIVKDEAANLAPCLDCLLPIADEIIIVDTGSTDETKQIAARYTEHVYDYTWTGDFSQARNYAFSFAKMEYIYSADADERLDGENVERFLLLKQAILPEVEIVQMRYANQLENGSVYNFDEEYRPKLFRRLRQFRWISPIHETVATAPLVFDSDIVIGHFPKQCNSARDFAAFCRATQAGRLDARLQHMYAMELYLSGSDEDFLQAQDYFLTCLDDEEARCVAARAARLRGDLPAFYRIVLPGVLGTPPSELCCEVGEFYYGAQAYDDATFWFYCALTNPTPVLTAASAGRWPMQGMAKCCAALGDSEQASAWQEKADQWSAEALSCCQ